MFISDDDNNMLTLCVFGNKYCIYQQQHKKLVDLSKHPICIKSVWCPYFVYNWKRVQLLNISELPTLLARKLLHSRYIVNVTRKKTILLLYFIEHSNQWKITPFFSSPIWHINVLAALASCILFNKKKRCKQNVIFSIFQHFNCGWSKM